LRAGLPTLRTGLPGTPGRPDITRQIRRSGPIRLTSRPPSHVPGAVMATRRPPGPAEPHNRRNHRHVTDRSAVPLTLIESRRSAFRAAHSTKSHPPRAARHGHEVLLAWTHRLRGGRRWRRRHHGTTAATEAEDPLSPPGVPSGRASGRAHRRLFAAAVPPGFTHRFPLPGRPCCGGRRCGRSRRR
jgi:hypothetical protein